jgi:nucleotide-binding universal stress UspA family protein
MGMVNCYSYILTKGDDPREEALKFAEEHGANAIFVGSRGLSKLDRIIMGSFSQYMIDHARCSVMLVKPKISKRTNVQPDLISPV